MENKVCPKCKINKPLSSFGVDRRAKNGKAVYCFSCNRKKSKSQRDNDPLLSKRMHLKTRYSLSLEDVADMMLKQGNACAVCGTEDANLVIDHNHSSGAVRGLLCNSCNCALGHLKEEPEVIKSLLTYIEKHEK